MQAQQIKALQRLTNAADEAARYTTLEHRGYMNGPVVSEIHHTFPDGTVQVSIHNATSDSDKRWFHATIHVIATVSPRGKTTVRHCEGLPRGCVDSAYLGARVRRQMRKARKN
jgi:hypothetical protein